MKVEIYQSPNPNPNPNFYVLFGENIFVLSYVNLPNYKGYYLSIYQKNHISTEVLHQKADIPQFLMALRNARWMKLKLIEENLRNFAIIENAFEELARKEL